MFDNQYEQLRIQKAEELKKAGINPYGTGYKKEITNSEFLEKFAYVKDLEEKKDYSKKVTLTGRIKFLRLMGKAAFAKIEDDTGIVQIYFSKDSLGEDWFKKVKKLIEVGDIIAATGYPFVTKTGELTLHTEKLELVTKAIVPLPEKYHGLQDIELRYRQRYLDMIMNPDVRKVFKMRSKIVSLIREFFEKKGFLEVETPMMHPIPGGANARPFVTHHNALGIDRYLRIAPELYLKRLVVGGFEAVFEINRNFRNEGMDHTHNPEFTMIEFYWAYHTYEDLMKLTEELFDYLFEKLGLPKILPYDEYEIDFHTPFKRVKYKDAIVEIGGIDPEIVENREKIIDFLKEKEIEVDENLGLGALQAELFDNFVEEKLINPTFVTHFPIEISPLARRSDEDPNIAERFELFIAGKEIANGFNELNDPLDQYERFKEQAAAKDTDDEAMHMDEDYVKALGYGMPPTAGEGIGIDRLVMLLTNQHSIRDVILFPAMKPLRHEEKEKKDEE
ncbi:lysine--tRNA ligase [Nitrosophilus alvini]|uniref:lysine--tRNA ligase n=1 Tax=Nitrosophilus alvini TaxID=2714855 RepID=UPI00190DF6EC